MFGYARYGHWLCVGPATHEWILLWFPFSDPFASPYHWALIAGIVMQTAAQTAAHVLSKTLTDRYLLRANNTYFEPRGLKVRLMKTAAMRRFVHKDTSEDESKWKKFGKSAGRTAETIGLRLPITSRVITLFSKTVSLLLLV
jgi:hypothetical protein